MKTITIMLADDHTIVREGLLALFAVEKDIEVIGEAQDGRAAVEMALRLRPAVVLMDIAMPLLNGLEATRQILRGNPEAKVIILSAHGDDAYVEQVMAMGAHGFLVKQSPARMLMKAVRMVHGGGTFFSPDIARKLLRQKERAEGMGEPDPRKVARALTPREREVLQLIAEGRANKETADVLKVSVKTVEKHRQNIMEKLNIHETAGLTRYAIANGVIESSSRMPM